MQVMRVIQINADVTIVRKEMVIITSKNFTKFGRQLNITRAEYRIKQSIQNNNNNKIQDRVSNNSIILNALDIILGEECHAREKNNKMISRSVIFEIIF